MHTFVREREREEREREGEREKEGERGREREGERNRVRVRDKLREKDGERKIERQRARELIRGRGKRGHTQPYKRTNSYNEMINYESQANPPRVGYAHQAIEEDTDENTDVGADVGLGAIRSEITEANGGCLVVTERMKGCVCVCG